MTTMRNRTLKDWALLLGALLIGAVALSLLVRVTS